MSERSEISRHEVEVFRVLAQAKPGAWLSNADIHAATDRVAARTVRATTLKLVGLGLVDQAEVFPSHRFRLSSQAAKRNRGYYDRLHRAAEALGITV